MPTEELCNATDFNLYNKLSFITKWRLWILVWCFNDENYLYFVVSKLMTFDLGL